MPPLAWTRSQLQARSQLWRRASVDWRVADNQLAHIPSVYHVRELLQVARLQMYVSWKSSQVARLQMYVGEAKRALRLLVC